MVASESEDVSVKCEPMNETEVIVRPCSPESSEGSPNKENCPQRHLRKTPRSVNGGNTVIQSAPAANGLPLPNASSRSSMLLECGRCEAMFRSQDAYDTHRKICFGGKDQLCFCKICGVRKDSEWTMDKHLFQHYCMDSKGCMDCGWRSDLHINPKPSPKKTSANSSSALHMSRPEAHDAQIPERKGYRITSNALRCMDCNALQDDIKSLQEHIKLCPKSSKPAVFVCYCRAEFADRKSFDQHINMMQCKELLLRKFQGLPFVPGFPPNMRPPTVAPPKPPQSRSPVSKDSPPSKRQKLDGESMSPEREQAELFCEKCNITFKKLEVFKVHKENYCESRHANVEAIQEARAQKQREREELKLVNKLKEQSKVRLQEEEANREYTQKAFPCHECKIGFDSRKHFAAHKQNYCPSRQTDSPGSEGSSSQPTSSSANLLQASGLLSMFSQNPLMSNLNLLSMLSAMNTQQANLETLKKALSGKINGSTTSPLDLSCKDSTDAEEQIKIEEVEEESNPGIAV
ncbi:Oidioi.mRNA.OKI2018_I69.chr2.g7620.t2.cds [Oikopleura dioica]|uniref:Oidioi.mRNA.OKI2018_I69.chr2.g7620.t2.cds n=1 Tax=Oikopleura dioica TaxID=34765 RepID=A0ABN7TFK7_OIKDI|nr:Oidioi.mRNA.OKI2018_I69.chr2.g7620.t2.cds [Oikopleura dioica]